ncbi:acetyl-CoA synthetase-like protein [Stipitochalara longipes BDJ]|nr:acetyl-CoA synthetase-like protein [Stipitochalara longipes BDJ]
MLSVILPILLLFILIRFLSRFFATKQQEEQWRDEKALAEIDGGPLANRMSVFLHLEEGLAKSLYKPAIISTYQHADQLGNLISLCTGIDEQKEHRERVQGFNGISEDSTYIRRDCLQLSFHQVHCISQELAIGILANGAQPGSTILMLIPNGAEFGLLLWASIVLRFTIACADLGGALAADREELHHLLRTLKPSLVVVADAETALVVDGLVEELHIAAPLRICLNPSPGLTLNHSHSPSGAGRSAGSRWMALVHLVEQGIASGVDRDELVEQARNDDPQRVHSVLFTSGSSGRPKGCPLRVGAQTHYMHSQAWLVDRQSCPLALQQAHPSRGIAHLQTLLTWKAGGAVVMTGRGFAVNDAAEALLNFPITFIALSPPMVHELSEFVAKNDSAALFKEHATSVSTVQVGGDAVTKGILMKCAALFPRARVVVAHGMTEGGGSFRWLFDSMPLPHIPYFGDLCPVGMVSPGSVVRIWNPDQMRVCVRGESGALHVCSGSLIHHYLLGVSESSFYTDDRGRWFITGDIAVMDIQGIVSILGRSKDMIKRGGVAIMPAPLENCIENLTGEQTVVVSIPHGTGESQPCAVLRSFAGKDPDKINNHIVRVLGKHYLPSDLLTLEQLGLDEFPINATHKVVKSELQQTASSSSSHSKIPQLWNGKRILAAVDYYAGERMLSEFEKSTGHKTHYNQITNDQYKSSLSAAFSFTAQEFLKNHLLLENPGYFGHESLEPSVKALGNQRTATWEEFVAKTATWR